MNSEYFSAYSSLNSQASSIKNKNPWFFSNLIVFAVAYIIFSHASLSHAASNYYVENEISLVLQKKHDQSEIVWLETDAKLRTIALHKPAQGVDTEGSAIILSDLNQNPDWSHIIRPIRLHLPQFGWETLSIQMPLKAEDASPADFIKLYNIAKSRIQAGVDYLLSKSAKNIVIIGYRHSANIATRYLAETEEIENIEALVIISSFDSSWIKTSQFIRNLKVGILDVYAQNDLQAVRDSAPLRLNSAKFAGQLIDKKLESHLSPKVQQLVIQKTGNLQFRQAVINGANDQFSNQQNTLNKTIRGWLQTYKVKK